MKKSGWKEFLRNNVISLIFVVSIIIIGSVIAGNVIVKEGAMDVSGDQNVNGSLTVNQSFSLNGNQSIQGTILGKYGQKIRMDRYDKYIDLLPDGSTWTEVAVTIANRYGTDDLFLQFNPAGSNSVFESYQRPFYIATGGSDDPIYFATNRIVRAQISSTGFNFTGDLFSDDKSFYFNGTNHQLRLAGNTSIYDSGVNTVFITNRSGGAGLAWFSNNVSATGYLTRTSVYDKSKGDALNYIKDSNDYLNPNGSINHNAFYGETEYQVTDYSRPVDEKYIVKECTTYSNENREEIEECKNIEKIRTTYPYTKTEQAVDLGKEIDVLRQAVFEIKDCTKKSSNWDEYQRCINGL